MAAHQTHKKQAIAYKVNNSRRFWRWWCRLGKICFELGLEYNVKNKS